jgi:O-Antigen ligase
MRRPIDLGALGTPFPDGGMASPTAQVKAAIASVSGKRAKPSSGFQFDRVSRREAIVAPLLGLYLAIAVARVHERFPDYAVDGLEAAMMATMLLTVLASVPFDGWLKVWRISRPFRMVALITACAVITIPLGVWKGGSTEFFMDRFTVALAVYISCLFLLRDRKVLRRIVAAYVIIVTIIATANLIAYVNHDVSLTLLGENAQRYYLATGRANAERLRQAYGSLDPNDIAAVMATTLPLALWLAVGGLGRRIFWTASAMVLALSVIPTASRGGLLGLMAAAVVLVIVGARGNKRFVLAGTLALGAVLFMVVAGPGLDRMEDVGGAGYNLTTSEGRIAIWKRGIVWTIKRPWGYGIGNFPIYFGRLNGPERAAHNSLIQYGVELGVTGLAAYLIACGAIVAGLWHIRRNALRATPPDNESIALTGHIMAMCVACWVTGFFLSNAYYPITYMVIGIGSAVMLSHYGRAEAPVPAPTPAVGRKVGAPSTRRRRQFKAFDTPR